MTSMEKTQTSEARRKTFLDLIVGINGTGKSTFIRQKILTPGRKVLVVTPDEAEWRTLPTVSTAQEIYNLQQPARLVADGTEQQLLTVTRSFFGGALVLDDAMAYLTFGATSPLMRYIYIRRRQFGVDIFVVAHGLRQIPVQAFTFASHLILFATTENFAPRKRELHPDIYNAVVSAQEQVNRQCSGGNAYAYKIITLDPQLR